MSRMIDLGRRISHSRDLEIGAQVLRQDPQMTQQVNARDEEAIVAPIANDDHRSNRSSSTSSALTVIRQLFEPEEMALSTRGANEPSGAVVIGDEVITLNWAVPNCLKDTNMSQVNSEVVEPATVADGSRDSTLVQARLESERLEYERNAYIFDISRSTSPGSYYEGTSDNAQTPMETVEHRLEDPSEEPSLEELTRNLSLVQRIISENEGRTASRPQSAAATSSQATSRRPVGSGRVSRQTAQQSSVTKESAVRGRPHGQSTLLRAHDRPNTPSRIPVVSDPITSISAMDFH